MNNTIENLREATIVQNAQNANFMQQTNLVQKCIMVAS